MKSKNTTRSNTARTRTANGKGRAVIAATTLALGIGALAFASPAVARDEFKNAFEFELGRIVAHEVAAVGHAILTPHVAIRHEVYAPVVYEVPHHAVRVHDHQSYGPKRHARACGHDSGRGHFVDHKHRRDHRIERGHDRHAARASNREDRRDRRAAHQHERREVRASNDRERRDDRAENQRNRRGY